MKTVEQQYFVESNPIKSSYSLPIRFALQLKLKLTTKTQLLASLTAI